jgi:hypothetical protein
MKKDKFQILTKHQKELLIQILKLAEDKENVFYMV